MIAPILTIDTDISVIIILRKKVKWDVLLSKVEPPVEC